jgi:Zn-dependent peptidase ImmA (M78 family)/transcriptional regulator with XRE-family HTH domain
MARRSTEALVKPGLLTWARSSAGLTIEEAARSLQTKPAKVAAWEVGEASPSMSQLRKMAATYKRLLSDFYLPKPPVEEPLPHDFRRLPGEVALQYSPALRCHLRQARLRRALAIDLASELEVEMPVLTPHILQNGEPEKIGAQVRSLLGVPLSLQRTWRDARKSYNSWRAYIEDAGVLVFQMTGVKPEEILGFSITERPLPVIAVNRKLTPNGRTFTLLHELVHVLLDESAICDIDEDESRPPEEQHKEVLCNAIAAAALVPREALLAENLVTAHPANLGEWTDHELDSLARTFSVSTHVILRRLLREGRTTKAFYAASHDRWRTMLELPKGGADSDDKFRRNMPQEVVSDLGRPFTRLVLDSYENSRMSLSDVSRFLGIRAEGVQKVREIMLRS